MPANDQSRLTSENVQLAHELTAAYDKAGKVVHGEVWI